MGVETNGANILNTYNILKHIAYENQNKVWRSNSWYL